MFDIICQYWFVTREGFNMINLVSVFIMAWDCMCTVGISSFSRVHIVKCIPGNLVGLVIVAYGTKFELIGDLIHP